MIPTRHLHRSAGAALIAVALTALSACGDDDPAGTPTTAVTATTTTTTTTTTGATGSDPTDTTASASTEHQGGSTTPAADDPYCAKAAELNEQDDFPSAEQLADYHDLAPAEIADAITTVQEAHADGGGDPAAIFADPDAVAAIEEITAFEAERCGFEPPTDPDMTTIDPDAPRIDVVGADHTFDLDPPSTAGRYSFVMSNTGAEPHLMILLQLEDGVSVEDVLAAEGETGVLATFESGIATPGGEAVVTADLAAGRYALLCPIPSAGGAPHFALGMLTEFTVS